jgi:hypothetical protein
MADKSIGYKIVVDTAQSVKNIQALEEQIKELKAELAGISQTSDAYDTLQAAIGGLEKQYEGLINKAIEAGEVTALSADETTAALEGTTQAADNASTALNNTGKTAQKTGSSLEGSLKAFVKFGAGIASAFAGAQAVVGLLGGESEELAAAATKAQNLLTLAITAKEIAEGNSAIATVTATIAQKAKNIADTTSIGILRVLFGVIAANPLGALAVAIGAVVAAFALFNKSGREGVNVQKELSKATSDEASKLGVYTRILTDVNSKNNERAGVIEELVEMYPGFNVFIDDENRLNAQGVLFLELKTKALIKEAQAKLLVQKIAENNNKILEIENRSVEESLTTFDKLEGQLVKLFSAYGDVGKAFTDVTNAAKNNRKETKGLEEDNANLEKALAKVKGEESDISALLKPLEELMKKYADATKGGEKATKDLNKATAEQIALQKQLEDQLNNTLTSIEELTSTFEKLATAGGFDPIEPDVVKKIAELRSNIEGLIPKDLADKFKSIGLEAKLVGGQFVITSNQLKELEDVFGNFVEKKRPDLTNAILGLDPEKLKTLIGEINDEASKLFQEGLITKEALEAGLKLTKQYEDLGFVLTALPKEVKQVFTPEKVNEFLGIIQQVSIAVGDITFQKVDGEIKKIEGSTVGLTNELNKLKEFTDKAQASLIEKYKNDFQAVGGLTEDVFKSTVKSYVDTGALTKEQGEEILGSYQDFATEAPKLIDKLAKSQVDALTNTTQNIIKEETAIREFLFRAQEDRTAALKLQGQAQAQVFLQNLELVYDFTQKENQIVIDAEKTTADQREQIKKDLAQKGIDITQLSEKEIDEIITFYLEKQNAAEEKAALKRKERYDKIIEGIQQFQSVLNSLSQTTSMLFDAQFDQLDKRYKRLQDTIIGDTEEANQKRLEAEKAYQAERAALEKKAAKTALRISLAQALANTAEAITKLSAITGGIGAIVAGGALVAFNAVQVGIIANQLATIDSYKKGGRLKPKQMAGGGMLFGPSHEQGGIKFAQGGFELEGNESVINRFSTLNYMGLLSQINQAGGGKPIGPGFDDSRIVEAIAKQRNTPIRAYVVESDITAKQETARRIEKLSQI